jgi:hypothetical protein
VPLALVSPTIFFTPVNVTVPGKPIAMLADPIDPATGELLSIERGFDPTDAAVINAVRTVRGSGSAVEDVGHQFGSATHITPKLEISLREEARLALENLTSSKQIVMQEVSVQTEDTEAGVLLVYENVAKGERRELGLPLGAARAVS